MPAPCTLTVLQVAVILRLEQRASELRRRFNLADTLRGPHVSTTGSSSPRRDDTRHEDSSDAQVYDLRRDDARGRDGGGASNSAVLRGGWMVLSRGHALIADWLSCKVCERSMLSVPRGLDAMLFDPEAAPAAAARGRLARQPGMAACSTAALFLVVPLLVIVIPEIFGAIKTANLKAALGQAVGVRSEADRPVVAYGPPTSAATTPTVDAGEPPPTRVVLTPFLPSTPSRRPYLHEPFWLSYSMNVIHMRIISRAYIASAIAGAWLTLVLAGCWRPERSWIDRFGTFLGLSWVVFSLGWCGASFLFQ